MHKAPSEPAGPVEILNVVRLRYAKEDLQSPGRDFLDFSRARRRLGMAP
jgi:hypothetical protein